MKHVLRIDFSSSPSVRPSVAKYTFMMLCMPANNTMAFCFPGMHNGKLPKQRLCMDALSFLKRNREVRGRDWLRQTRRQVTPLSSSNKGQNREQVLQVWHKHISMVHRCIHATHMPSVQFPMWGQHDINTHTRMHNQLKKHLITNKACVSHQQLCHISTIMRYMKSPCRIVHATLL